MRFAHTPFRQTLSLNRTARVRTLLLALGAATVLVSGQAISAERKSPSTRLQQDTSVQDSYLQRFVLWVARPKADDGNETDPYPIRADDGNETDPYPKKGE